MGQRPDELRADLMETYGLMLDAAADGGASPLFVAALAAQLPQDCRWKVSYDQDAWWTGDRMLYAGVLNTLRAIAWGISDKKKRGSPPRPVGPKWAVEKDRSRQLPALAMSRAELEERLSMPRKRGDGDGGGR